MILTAADTLLSLEEFRQILQMNPYRFWQLDSSNLSPQRHACDDLLFEYDWQSADAISRQAMRAAIARAERKLADWLGYDIFPRYRESTIEYVIPAQDEYSRGASNSRGQYASARLPYGYVQKAGVRRSVLIGQPAVAIYDKNNDGINDTFVATLATTATDASQIACYVPASERWETSAELDQYRIRPVSVAIAGGQATITGKVWQIVRPVEYADMTGAAPLSLDDESTFLDSLAVYHEYIDPDGTTVDDAQCTLLWETTPAPYWCAASVYGPNASDPAAIGKAAGRVGIRNAQAGFITPAEAAYDASAAQWRQVGWSNWREPDRVLVRYLAGIGSIDRQAEPFWRQTVAYFALAELEGPICACDGVRKRSHHWQFDLARTDGSNDESYGAISADDLSNPFGTRRGQVEAWRQIRNLRTLVGFAF